MEFPHTSCIFHAFHSETAALWPHRRWKPPTERYSCCRSASRWCACLPHLLYCTYKSQKRGSYVLKCLIYILMQWKRPKKGQDKTIRLRGDLRVGFKNKIRRLRCSRQTNCGLSKKTDNASQVYTRSGAEWEIKRDKEKGDTDTTDKQTDGRCEQSVALKCKIHQQ